MKNLFKKSILALTVLMLVFSCSQENDIAPRTEPMSESIANNLNGIADGLRANKQTFANTELVAELGKQSLENRYGSNSDELNSYSRAFQSVNLQNARTSQDLNLSDEANQFLSLIQVSSNNANHLKAYKESLSVIDQQIIDSGLSEDERTILRTQIISLQTSLTFIAANFDLFQPQITTNGRVAGDGDEEQDEGWWESWGKCAAGTLGGALTGGLGGAGIGSAVPVIGTTVGGVVGVIGGGLTGAAASC